MQARSAAPSSNVKRHCMVVHAYYPFAETRVEREAQALVDRGYEVDILSLGGKNQPAFETRDGINVYRLPVRRHASVSVLTQLIEYLTFFVLVAVKLARLQPVRRYRVVQVHNLPDFLIFAAFAPKLMGARLILDLHDLMPEFFAARTGKSLSSAAVRLVAWQEFVSCAFADHVITVTDHWKQSLVERGVPERKITVVMNVPDDRIFRPVADASNTPVNGHFRLIYHGTLTLRYGLDLAIQAVARVRNEIPGIHLTIHGWGDDRPELEELTRRLGLEQNVSFSSERLPTAQLPRLIQEAHVAVVPYRTDVFTDGILPTKLMEYATLRVPVIAARTTGIASYFDSNMVEFFEPDNVNDLARCIRDLYADTERRKELMQGAGRFVERYNWAQQSAEYAALVEQLGSASPRQAVRLKEKLAGEDE